MVFFGMQLSPPTVKCDSLQTEAVVVLVYRICYCYSFQTCSVSMPTWIYCARNIGDFTVLHPSAHRAWQEPTASDPATPTMTRVEDGRKKEVSPIKTALGGEPWTQRTRWESFCCTDCAFPLASLQRDERDKQKSISQSCFACSPQGAWSLGYIFPPCSVRPRNVCAASLYLKEVGFFSQAEECLGYISIYFFWISIFSARCFERQGG